MAPAAADCHVLSLTPLRCPPKGTGCLPWGPSARHRSVHAVPSWQLLCSQFIPLDPRRAPRTPPRSAPWQSTIAQGMQNNASLFCIFKKTVRVLLERMSCLPCSSLILSGFSCQENWPRCSPLYEPHSSLQILQADTLAPPVAFGLC